LARSGVTVNAAAARTTYSPKKRITHHEPCNIELKKRSADIIKQTSRKLAEAKIVLAPFLVRTLRNNTKRVLHWNLNEQRVVEWKYARAVSAQLNETQSIQRQGT